MIISLDMINHTPEHESKITSGTIRFSLVLKRPYDAEREFMASRVADKGKDRGESTRHIYNRESRLLVDDR
jgi:hypothetical protein